MGVDADEAMSRRGGGRVQRPRSVKQFPKTLVSLDFQSNMLAGLRTLKRAVTETALRPAAYAGARVFYEEMRLNVPIASGQLYDSVYHWFDDKHSNTVRKIYVIGPNKAKAPHWYNVEYGHWRYNKYAAGRWLRSKSNRNARGPSAHDLPGALETPVWVPAKPYIRVTYTGKARAAVNAMQTRLGEKVSEIIQEMSA